MTDKETLTIPILQGGLDVFIQASYPAPHQAVMCGETKASCYTDRLWSKHDSCVTRHF